MVSEKLQKRIEKLESENKKTKQTKHFKKDNIIVSKKCLIFIIYKIILIISKFSKFSKDKREFKILLNFKD